MLNFLIPDDAVVINFEKLLCSFKKNLFNFASAKIPQKFIVSNFEKSEILYLINFRLRN